MAKIYANENFPLPTVAALRKLGHDVLTTREVGNADLQIPDEGVLEFAKTTGRIVLTLNRTDFYRLHRNSPTHAGIITCTRIRILRGWPTASIKHLNRRVATLRTN